MSLFLLASEIQELTGLQQPCAQKRWFSFHDWIYAEDIRGRPKIARAYFDLKMTKTKADDSVVDKSSNASYSVNALALQRAA